MAMHHPHPGEFISGVYLEPNGISGHELAEKLDVAASTLSRILKGTSRVTAYSHAFDLGSPYGLTISGKKADRYPQEADNPVWYQACF